MMCKRIKKQDGFTMVELLVSIGMVAILAVATASIASFSKDSAGQTRALTTVLSLRNMMVSMIENPTAWDYTAAADADLSCVKNQKKCYRGAHNLKLYDNTGNVFYDGNSTTQGFTSTGMACNTYAANTTTDCIYHYDLTWQAICSPGPKSTCDDQNPLARVTAQLQIAKTTNRQSQISADSYSIAVIKGYETNSIEKNCVAVNGVFNVEEKKCVTSVSKEKRCPAGTSVTRVDDKGDLTCSPPFDNACPNGTYLKARNDDGSPVCASKCASFTVLPLPPLGSFLDIPVRNGKGDCYAVKIFDAIPVGPSINTMGFDTNIISRDHTSGGDNSYLVANPYILGVRTLNVLLRDQRAVRLSSSSITPEPITVDNYMVIGVMPASTVNKVNSFYKVYGSSDIGINGTNTITINGEPMSVNGGNYKNLPLDLTSLTKPKEEFTVDLKMLDCGGIRESSDVYMLFQ